MIKFKKINSINIGDKLFRKDEKMFYELKSVTTDDSAKMRNYLFYGFAVLKDGLRILFETNKQGDLKVEEKEIC